jgi:allantoate deiminase/N-carbamoyl-L-amino-acid hydrolase
MQFGPTLLRQAAVLAAFSEDPAHITRTYLSPQHRQAGEQILTWMREAGMDAGFDAMGNAVGRYAAASAGAPILITGSHMDSVVNAGMYDGILGVLCAIACVRELNARGTRLHFALEVVAFCDEEGVRYGVTMLGSKALAGTFDPAMLELADAQGQSMRNSLTAFGGQPEAIASLKRDPARVRGFVELHIEQGPVLLNQGMPVGVVTSIAGATRVRVRVQGLAGHAGTTPMPGRKDALAAAAEMVLLVERYCAEHAGNLVGTVGKLAIPGGGATNVIPGEVEFSIDLRSAQDSHRLAALPVLEAECQAIAKRRNVTLHWDAFFHLAATPCDSAMQAQLADSIQACGIKPVYLLSGAGHDAMEIARLTPVSMLFVRCGNGGISHNPLETITAEDAELGTRVLLHFLQNLK